MTLDQKEIEKQDLGLEPKRGPGDIDASLVEYSLTLTYEERIEANDSAIELERELQKAGREFYARKLKSPT